MQKIYLKITYFSKTYCQESFQVTVLSSTKLVSTDYRKLKTRLGLAFNVAMFRPNVMKISQVI